jgi:hypothetical protein
MLIDTLEWATVVLGATALVFAVVLALQFLRSNHPLGLALGMQLAGESVGITVTLIFAIGTATGYNWYVSPVQMMILRWVFFLTALVTSMHLGWKVFNIKGDRH